MKNTPSPYFEHNPKLQRAWDSTSLGSLMFCPRYYQYNILEGWRGSSLDLEFGILAHSAFEIWSKARLAGESKDQAKLLAVQYVVENSGHYEVITSLSEGSVWVPWGGMYLDQWRCTGETPYKNAKGNKAKCPYAHAGKWQFSDAPSVCGECGSGIVQENRWVPADKAKDRLGLVRMVAWWCDEQPDTFGTGVDPWKFEDGTPAVELSFKLPLPFGYEDKEPYILCGHLDGIAQFGEELFVRDHKTTSKSLGASFFAGYSPNIQMDVYDLAAYLMFQELGVRGVMVDGIQLLAGGARFAARPIYRTDAQREEFLAELEWWVRQAERYAEEDYWPMNRRNCWLCGFKGICSKDPEYRQQYLSADFEQKKWNPLEER